MEKELKQQIKDLKLLFIMLNNSKGCGCCANYTRLAEITNIASAMKILPSFKKEDEYVTYKESYLQWLKEMTSEFEELRKRYNVPAGDDYE